MRRRIFLALFCVALSNPGIPQNVSGHLAEWRDNKYSMFIHFGLYSELGGVWKGQKIAAGYSEQIQSHGGIFSDEYARVATTFSPARWNADSIVLLAKAAGMRSVVITSKHHDGFCMFDTESTGFNIVDATPFKRDVVSELADACRRHGLKFGLYFSLIDWHYPQAYPISSHNADFITPEHHEYNKKQLQELLSRYGDISELWFDMGSLTREQSTELRALVKKLQPDCLISGRLGNDQGDFCVMGDNEYPSYAIDVPWQVPASMYNETWGYRSWQEHVPVEQKVFEKLSGLIKTTARGGNYLLNIGPKGDGSVPRFEQDVLRDIGQWLDVNGEAIYATKPVRANNTSKLEMTARGNKLYLFLFGPVSDNKVMIDGLASKVISIAPLDSREEKMVFNQTGETLTIGLPAGFVAKDAIRVIEIENEDIVSFVSSRPIAVKRGVELNKGNAQQHYSFSGVDYYSNYRSTVKYSWYVVPTSPQQVQPVIYYSEQENGRDFILSINGSSRPLSLSGGEVLPLKKQDVKWGSIWITGELPGFIDQLHGDLNKLDVSRKWGGNDWAKQDSWTNNLSYQKEAGMFQNWYWLQEITTRAPGLCLIRVPVNDGVSVYLNGQELFITNNHDQTREAEASVLLPLVAGTNRLLVKYFNRFASDVKLGVFNDSPQILYKTPLSEIRLEKGEPYKIELQLPAVHPVHENLRAPNISVQLIQK